MIAYETAPATDAAIARWRSSHRMYERAASLIATSPRDQERGSVRPDNSVFQRTLTDITGDEPSPSAGKR